MQFDLSGYRLHLTLCPVDMRYGFYALNDIAQNCLGVDVNQGQDCVIFMSNRRNVCKLIWSDQSGHVLLTRKLRQGRFQKILSMVSSPSCTDISLSVLLQYLDGLRIQKERTFI